MPILQKPETFDAAHARAERTFSTPSQLQAKDSALKATTAPGNATKGGSVIHIYVDGKKGSVSDKDFHKSVNRFIEKNTLLNGNDPSPGGNF